MWPALVRLKAVLPDFLWQKLRARYWRGVWRQESAKNSQSESIAGSERATLIEAIGDYYPFHSLLEIGCAYGQNFHILAPLFPRVKFTGIDIDAERIAGGQALLQEKGLSANVQLLQLSADELAQFPSKSFDLVISSASLLYIDSQKIRTVVSEMLRVASRAVIFLEQHEPRSGFAEQHLGSFIAPQSTTPGYWLRDYEKLCRELGVQKIKVQKVPLPIWQTEQWKRLACVIEAKTSETTTKQTTSP